MWVPNLAKYEMNLFKFAHKRATGANNVKSGHTVMPLAAWKSIVISKTTKFTWAVFRKGSF